MLKSLIKDMEDLISTQSLEMKSTMSKMKNTLDKINGLEDIATDYNQNGAQVRRNLTEPQQAMG